MTIPEKTKPVLLPSAARPGRPGRVLDVRIEGAGLALRFARLLIFAGLVALGEAIRPDPIPNSAVKRLSANGTLSQDTGE